MQITTKSLKQAALGWALAFVEFEVPDFFELDGKYHVSYPASAAATTSPPSARTPLAPAY